MGPFAKPKERRTLFVIQYAPKNTAMGRAVKRKTDLENDESERVSDPANYQCLSIDQQISIKGLYLQKKIHIQHSVESSMISLIAHKKSNEQTDRS